MSTAPARRLSGPPRAAKDWRGVAEVDDEEADRARPRGPASPGARARCCASC